MRSEKLRKRLYHSLGGAANGIYVGLRERFLLFVLFCFFNLGKNWADLNTNKKKPVERR